MEKEFMNQLYSNRLLRDRQEIEKFEEGLEMLSEVIQEDDISELCGIFDDNTMDDEVMFGLIHLIEQFQGKGYLGCIAKYSPNMNRAHNWAMVLNKRILNSQKYFEQYVEVIANIESKYQAPIMELLMDVKNDNPEKFGEKVNYILEKVNI